MNKKPICNFIWSSVWSSVNSSVWDSVNSSVWEETNKRKCTDPKIGIMVSTNNRFQV
jgi:hypothetical protein